jgi:RecA/RadA recombinase
MGNDIRSLAHELLMKNEFVDTYADVDRYIDTGSYILNALLSGSIYKGLPGNKITALAGESSTGKTYFALGVVSQFLKDNPTGGVIFFESESAITKKMLLERGIDLERLVIVPVSTVQEFRYQALLVLNKYMDDNERDRRPLLICLDSLGMLSTTKEMEDSTEGKETKDMTRAAILKAAFRVLTLKLGRAKVPMIVTNHTYDVIGSMYPQKEMGGGSGLKYAADYIVYLSRKKEKDGTEVVGHVIHCKNHKSRLTKENKMVDVLLRYDTGLNRYYGLVDLAVEHGIFKKVSTRIEVADGTKVFAKAIYKAPEKYFTKEILDQLDTICQKEFAYGSEIENDDGETIGRDS